MEQVLAQRNQCIQERLDAIALLKRQRFGPSGERVSPDQLGLFNEAEFEAQIGALEQQAAPQAEPVCLPLLEQLPRVDRVIDLAPEDKAALGEDWVLISYDEAEQLAIIPRHPDAAGADQGVIIAPRAPQILPKAIAHSSLLADIVVAKYADALPLYRQERSFARDGLDIPRQSRAGWMVALEEPLAPLMAAMKALLDAGPVLHIDETHLQVFAEPGRAATQQSLMWVYRGGPPGRAVILVDYSETRSGAAPRAFLRGLPLAGVSLLTDGYGVYSALALEVGLLGHAGCWPHARRKFVEATAGRSHRAVAHQLVALIGKLYTQERRLKNAIPAERQQAPAVHSRPILDAIKTWLDEKAPTVLPKSLLGKAIAYALGLWPQRTTFLKDGHIPIDNNPAKNSIRPFVVGRKNWLFTASPHGAKASAMLCSLIESTKANGLAPRAYLGFLLERLPTAKTPADIAALLPQNLAADDIWLPPVTL